MDRPMDAGPRIRDVASDARSHVPDEASEFGGGGMRKYCLVAVVFAVSWSQIGSAGGGGVDLHSLAGWDIVVGEKAIPSEAYAARELQQFIQQATGVLLPIRHDAHRPDRHFFVGESPAMRASKAGFDVKKFGPEDLRIVVRDNVIVIAGGRPRGTLYGVYTFLEDYLGIRFLTCDHTFVPKAAGKRGVGPVDRFYHPPLSYRWSYYAETSANPAFATRLRNNAITEDSKFGGKTAVSLINHSFYAQIPSQKYGKAHPEYYCEIDGKRLASVQNDALENQPCLTNPEVLKIVTKAVLDQLDAHPELANVSVSQNDNKNYCRCVRCVAIDQREGTPMGSLLTFVNAVADAVAKKHPKVKVGTLSYWYSRTPPKTIRPRPNVQIQLCSIECCMIHAINDPTCPKNVAFCRDLAAWGKICNDISIWNYNTNFSNYLLPCPNFQVIEPNIRYFVANHAQGVFMQAVYNTPAGEMADLRNYVISNLLWDPSRSGRQLIDEFIRLHYGRAGEPIRRYLDRVRDHVLAAGVHPNCFGRAADYAVEESMVKAGFAAFVEAMKLAETDEERSRMEKASLCVYRAVIESAWNADLQKPLASEQVAQLRPRVETFFELCRKHGVTMTSEGERLEDAERRLTSVLN